jgi:hypothetical protein
MSGFRVFAYSSITKRPVNQRHIAINRMVAELVYYSQRKSSGALIVPGWGRVGRKAKKASQRCPAIFFIFFETSTENLVRDSEGALLSNAAKAKKEALDLARDIVGHELQGSTWQVVVTDENADTVLRVPLCEICPRKMKAWFDVVRRAAMYEPKLQAHIFTWLLTAVVLAVIVQAAVLTNVSRHRAEITGSFHTCRNC